MNLLDPGWTPDAFVNEGGITKSQETQVCSKLSVRTMVILCDRLKPLRGAHIEAGVKPWEGPIIPKRLAI
jgi:hypothetical protein